MTASHKMGDRLKPLFTAMTALLGFCFRGRKWEEFRDAMGFVGSVRVVEVKTGDNGWHPHVHAVLFFDGELEGRKVVEFRTWLRKRWLCRTVGLGLGDVSVKHGVDIRYVYAGGDPGAIAEYLTKIEGGLSTGLEMTREDLKVRGGRSPWELLADFHDTGDLAALRRWREYDRATSGRRFMVWSRGLRARLIPDVEEVEDAVLAAAEGMGEPVAVFVVSARRWAVWSRWGTVGRKLAGFEAKVTGAFLPVSWLVPTDP
jgi:hypothetical protein